MSAITMREAISQALWEEMERDENVFIMGEEVGVWGGTYAVTRGFYDHFGEKRVRDTPISEMAIVGAATGAASRGRDDGMATSGCCRCGLPLPRSPAAGSRTTNSPPIPAWSRPCR